MKRLLVYPLLLLVACATGETLRRDGEAMKTRLDGLRETGAHECAPREVAMAETNLEFMDVELDQGNAVRATDHRDLAQTALLAALQKVKDCKPKDRDGDGIPDDNDQCPDTPGIEKFFGCPDTDGDGIPDHVDRCPKDPEDFDEFEDEDGCPDPDNDKDGVLDPDDACPNDPGPKENKGCPVSDRDGDGIPDARDSCPDKPGPEKWEGCPDSDGDGIPDHTDKCPEQPEIYNDFQDEDGCPDINPSLVVVNREAGKIEIKQKVFFDTGKAVIKSVSFQLLNEVAGVLKANPSMEIVVEGHTDSVGSDAMNMRLSQKRSESVRTYLIAQGVDASHLKAMGFGETQPIDTNETADGRERNRRVEFTIVKE